MSCGRFVTLEDFYNSPYECSIASCCNITGEARDIFIDQLLEESQIMIESYLGKEICKQTRKDVFIGDDSYSYFLRHLPIDPTGEVTIEKRHRYGNYSGASTPTVVESNFFYLEDESIGSIRNTMGFSKSYSYAVEYTAGYELTDIPKDIKRAVMLLAINLSQRLDNMNLSNIDFSVASIKVDKASSTAFGSSGVVKQVIAKSFKELNDLPLPVIKILDRYKYNSSM